VNIDEEEKDTDDWDLDFGPYYDSTTGDKDARDFVQMKRDERRRQGVDCADEEMYDSRIGQFEKYSKVSEQIKNGYYMVSLSFRIKLLLQRTNDFTVYVSTIIDSRVAFRRVDSKVNYAPYFIHCAQYSLIIKKVIHNIAIC